MSEIHFPSPMVFAHRGASASAPENTLAAFQLALESGSHGIEFDVKLSGDGEVIIQHDQTLDRTTNGNGDIRRFTLNQIKQLDAGSKFDPKFTGERIPTLRELFELLGGKLILNIELTNYASPRDDLVVRVVSLVRQFQLQDSVIFSSFFPGNLIQARKLCPEIPNGLLCLPGLPGWFSRSPMPFWIPREALHPYVSDVTQGLVDFQHQKSCRVHVWTVNEEDDMRRLWKMGVDGIFTDDPASAMRVLKDLK
jgi:glycerophosphoryl diester phosphodiesterase